MSAVAKALGLGWDLVNDLAVTETRAMVYDQPGHFVADRACRYRGSGELVPLFRRPGTGPRVRRAGTVGGYSQ